MPKINQEEYEILKGLGDTWKWIARNEDGILGVYDAKVVKTKFHNFWVMAIKKKIDLTLFSFIQWEDEEPYNIANLIAEYEYSAEHVSYVVNERVKALGKAWSESEGTEVKNVSDVIEKVERNINVEGRPDNEKALMRLIINDLEKLDEPEVLSQKWIDEHRKSYTMEDSVEMSDLQNLLVPKQEEVDRAYKDGYETGKQHTFYKGYLEGITDKGSEPETVADVVTTFWKSYERLKEVMSMEIEELEE